MLDPSLVRVGVIETMKHGQLAFAVACDTAYAFENAALEHLTEQGIKPSGPIVNLPVKDWFLDRGMPAFARETALAAMRHPPIAGLPVIRGPYLQVRYLDDFAPTAPGEPVIPEPVTEYLKLQGKTLFALIDGAVISALPERIESDELPFTSLLRGAALEEIGEASPWLVALNSESTVLRQLLSSAPDEQNDWAFWDRNAAVFFLADMSLDALAKHLRRFLRAQGSDGKWRLFRFFDPRVLQAYLLGISDWEARTRHWFEPMGDGDGSIDAILTFPTYGGATVFSLNFAALSEHPPVREAFRLTDRDRAPLRAAIKVRRVLDMADDLKRLFPLELSGRAHHDIVLSVHHTVDRFAAFGVTHAGDLLICAAWDLIYGMGFESRVEDGLWPQRLLQPGDGRQKIAALADAIERNPPYSS